MNTRLPLRGDPTYYAVLRAGLWHVQREHASHHGKFRNCLCVVDDNEPETEEKYLEDQIITCLDCQVGLANQS